MPVNRSDAAKSSSGFDRGWQTPRLGRLQGWLHKRDLWRLGNALSTLRWHLWLRTGGSYD